MYSLHLSCRSIEVERLSAELAEFETAGIQEIETADAVHLIAAFAGNARRAELLATFAEYSPVWLHETEADWIAVTQAAWPGRRVGARFFLAAPWCREPTPERRLRLVHNPGLACGTGEHPCTQLALVALEEFVREGDVLLDLGSGSGMLAIAAQKLGAALAVAADIDGEALRVSRENFFLNELEGKLVKGSAEAFASGSFDMVVANIDASVLLSLAEDIMRVLGPSGRLVLTGFSSEESEVVGRVFGVRSVRSLEGWACVVITP